jgi:sec-independent protein translocase protein TatA
VNIFGIGLPEMALIMVVALLIFGPKKLPEIGRSLGKAIRGFQDASKEFENEFKREAERLEQIVTEPMEAKLEPPSQPVLAPATSEPATEAEANEVATAMASDEVTS